MDQDNFSDPSWDSPAENPLPPITEEIIVTMEQMGGSFVKALAALYRRGDPINQRRIVGAFPEYFAEYVKMTRLRLEAEAKGIRIEKI